MPWGRGRIAGCFAALALLFAWDKIKNSDPVWPTTAFDAETLVDPELKELINKFLTKDPKQRISLPEAQEKKNCAWILKNLYEVVILRTCISCCADYQTP